MVSKRYPTNDDGCGNINNVFRFHNRTAAQEKTARLQYPLIKIPIIETGEISEYNTKL